MAQAFGVIDILVSSKSSEHRLPQQSDESVATVLSGACVGTHIASHGAETKGIVEFTASEQPGIGGDPRAMELKLEATVEVEPQRVISRFTRWVLLGNLIRSMLNC